MIFILGIIIFLMERLEIFGLQKFQEVFILVFKKVKSTLFSDGSWFTIF